VAPAGTASEKVTHELFIVRRDMKEGLLEKILKQYTGSVLIFCRTKVGASKVARALRRYNHAAVEIHSDRTQGQRRQALDGFKAGRYRIMVATDIAARGIDVKGVELVINYDLPETAENYVHRIGRTGRAACQGHAIAFAMPDQKSDVLNIEQFLKIAIPRSTHPDIPEEVFSKPQAVFSTGRSGRYGRRPPSRR
jgi:ATP-dependent RNA helicase RhlE